MGQLLEQLLQLSISFRDFMWGNWMVALLVLTGIILGLLAQGTSSEEAAIVGVYLHGLAGDRAAIEKTQFALIAGDIVEYIGEAYRILSE